MSQNPEEREQLWTANGWEDEPLMSEVLAKM